jgi:hypothetical protein
MAPTILGFPIWKGHVKRRVLNKYMNRFRNKWMLGPYGQEMSKLGVGDFINDCTGFNRRIAKLYPEYYVVGTRRMRYHEPVRETGARAGNGFILIDVDITTEQGGGCSLCSCGVQPKLSVAEIESKTLEFIREWTLGSGGKTWYGKNSEDYKKVVKKAHEVIKVIESGGHITDADGQMLEEFRVKL